MKRGPSHPATDSFCRRCGTCCEKGGPSLHRDDRSLVDDGHIPAHCLFTIRRGELVRDNIKGTLTALSEEIIKIKGISDRWSCVLYDRATCGCGIYDHRPMECRALNCRDTRRIERIYQTARLTRKDLLSDIQGLWELVQDHEQRCSYASLQALVEKRTHGDGMKHEEAILETLRFDAHIRELTVKRAGMAARMLDFIFGRPLAATIKMFDLRLVKNGETYGLASLGPCAIEQRK